MELDNSVARSLKSCFCFKQRPVDWRQRLDDPVVEKEA